MIAESPNRCPGTTPHPQGRATPIILDQEIAMEFFIGIDVAKATLEVASLPDAENLDRHQR